jgi:hypothetical protein
MNAGIGRKIAVVSVLVLSCSLMASESNAVYTNFHYHPGAMCQPMYGSQATDFDSWWGWKTNKSASNREVICPFKTKGSDFDSSDYSVGLYVWDRHPTAGYDFSCRVYVKDFDSTSVYYSAAATTSGWDANPVWKQITAYNGYAAWIRYIRCQIPGSYGGTPSSITQYHFSW